MRKVVAYELLSLDGVAERPDGRKLFERGVPKRLSVTRTVTSPSGYLLVDVRFER